MKMGPWAGQLVPDMVGVFDIVPSGFDLMREGGSVGMVCGHISLVLGITSLVAGGRASWGASSVVRGSMMQKVVHASPCASPLSSYSGTLLVWLASAIPCLTRLPPSSTLHLEPFLISCVP